MTKFNCKTINLAVDYLKEKYNDYIFDNQIDQNNNFCAVDGIPEISNDDCDPGIEQVIEEFEIFFDNENEWIDEECSNYEQDKKDFIETVVNRFRNNN